MIGGHNDSVRCVTCLPFPQRDLVISGVEITPTVAVPAPFTCLVLTVIKPSFASVDRRDHALIGTGTCGDLRTQVA